MRSPQIPKALALDLIREYELTEIERVLKKLETEIDLQKDPDAGGLAGGADPTPSYPEGPPGGDQE